MAPLAQMTTASLGERSHSLQDRTPLFVHTETVIIFTEVQISTIIFSVIRFLISLESRLIHQTNSND